MEMDQPVQETRMLKKLVLIAALAALIASAGTVPGVGHYRITLLQPAAVQGTVLKAGDYRLDLADTKLTIVPENGKNRVEVTVKVETEDQKFSSTSVRLDMSTGKAAISEIRLGGTKTKLVFNN
jgi:hypothetical protein